MTLNLDDLRSLAATIRTIAAPIHLTTCTVRTRSWNGGEIGTGAYYDEDLVIDSSARVSNVTPKQVLTSGGFFSFDNVQVTHITPSFSAEGVSGGYTLQQIAPGNQARIPPGVEYLYVLTGEMTGTFRLKYVNEDHALHYTLVLEEIATTAIAAAR